VSGSFLRLGTGTADDAELIQREGNRLCELVDGVLVEKPIESVKSLVAIEVAFALRRYLEDHPLGVVLGADGLLQIGPKLVRGPAVSFISWERFPGRTLPTERVWAIVPDLAVEVLSPGNTPAEMAWKVNDYRCRDEGGLDHRPGHADGGGAFSGGAWHRLTRRDRRRRGAARGKSAPWLRGKARDDLPRPGPLMRWCSGVQSTGFF